MTSDARRRTPDGYLKDQDMRITLLERRLARVTSAIGWDAVTDKPTTFPSDWSTLGSKPATFPSDWGTLAGKPSAFPPSPHTHNAGDITGGALPPSVTLTEGSWTDLTGYLASGITYSPDGSPDLAGIVARRVGQFVELQLGNFTVASMSVPTTGNITNTLILAGIPAEFRPSGGAAISPAWAGRIWSGYVQSNGNVILGAVTPNATATGTETWTNETLSGTAFYPAA